MHLDLYSSCPNKGFEVIHRLYEKRACVFFDTKGGQEVYSHTRTYSLPLANKSKHNAKQQKQQKQQWSDTVCRSNLFQCFHPAYVIVWIETCLHNLEVVVVVVGGMSDWVCTYSGRPDLLSHLWCWWSDPSSLTAGLLAESPQAKAATSSAVWKMVRDGYQAHL